MTIEYCVKLLMTWLTTYGFAFVIALTHGPFGLCKKFRETIIARSKHDWVKVGVICPVCIGFWVGIFSACWFETGVNGWLSAVGFVCVITALSPD